MSKLKLELPSAIGNMGIISFFFSTAADDVQRSQRQKEVKHLMTIKEEEIQ